MRRAILLLTMITAVLLVASGVALAAAGSLDLSFGGGDGKVLTDYGTKNAINVTTEDLIVQPDRKLVVAGSKSFGGKYQFSRFALTRYDSDGTLDKSFGGGDGKVETIVLPDENSDASALVAQPDGKLVAAGRTFGTSSNNLDFALVRYNRNGSIDTSFGGGDGWVSTDLKNGDRAEALALQPDGKLVAAGSAYKTAFDNQGPYGADIVAIARYNAK